MVNFICKSDDVLLSLLRKYINKWKYKSKWLSLRL